MTRLLPAVFLFLSCFLFSSCASFSLANEEEPKQSAEELALRDLAMTASQAGDYRDALQYLITAQQDFAGAEWVDAGLIEVTAKLLNELLLEADAKERQGSIDEATRVLQDAYSLLKRFLLDEEASDLASRIKALEALKYADYRLVDERAVFGILGASEAGSAAVQQGTYSDDGPPLVSRVMGPRPEIEGSGLDPDFKSFLSPGLVAGATWNVLNGQEGSLTPAEVRAVRSDAESLEVALLEKGAVVLDRSSTDNMELEISFSASLDPEAWVVLQLAMADLAELYSLGGGLPLQSLSMALEALAVALDVPVQGAKGLLNGAKLADASSPQMGLFNGSQISLHFGTSQGAEVFELSWDQIGAPVESWERVGGEKVQNMSSVSCQLQVSDDYSEAVHGSMPMYFDPHSNQFWGHEGVFRSHLASFEEYVTHMNSLLSTIPRLSCEGCGRDLGPGEERDPINYGSSQWQCSNEDCMHAYPVSYWLGYKPQGEAGEAPVGATYVSLGFTVPVDGVYEVAWHSPSVVKDGFVKCGAGLLGDDALDAAFDQVEVDAHLLAVNFGGKVTLINRRIVEDLGDGNFMIPSFGEDCSQLYERLEVQPPVVSRAFDEVNLNLGLRIVENESSKLLGVMHADVSYRQIMKSSCRVEDWPGLEEQRAALFEFVLDEVSAALPGL